ncbi:acyl-CoA-binding protein (ACBP)/diazepam binding inhibitor (DBI)/endozepine (EP) [Lecanora helva]
MVTQSPEFKQAIEDSRKLKAKPTNDELLEVGSGEDFSKATQPGTFDFQGKYKYNAWKKVVEEEKTSPEDAQKKYVTLVNKLKGTYGFEA